MTKLRFALFLAVPLIWGCDRVEEGDGVLLRFNYAAGEQYIYEMRDDLHREYNAEMVRSNGDASETKDGLCSKNQNQTIEMQVREAEDDLYRFQVSYKVTSDSVGPGDTCDKKYHDKYRKRIVGKKWLYALQMRSNGEVVAVEGENEEETQLYQRNYISRQPIFPDYKINPGFKWKHKINLKIPDSDPIPVVIKYKFTHYDTINSYPCAVIEYWSEFEKKTDMTGTRWNKEKFKKYIVHNTTNSVGKLYFAIQKGVMIQTESKINQTFAWEVIRSDGLAETGSSEMTDIERVALVSAKDDDTASLSER